MRATCGAGPQEKGTTSFGIRQRRGEASPARPPRPRGRAAVRVAKPCPATVHGHRALQAYRGTKTGQGEGRARWRPWTEKRSQTPLDQLRLRLPDHDFARVIQAAKPIPIPDASEHVARTGLKRSNVLASGGAGPTFTRGISIGPVPVSGPVRAVHNRCGVRRQDHAPARNVRQRFDRALDVGSVFHPTWQNLQAKRWTRRFRAMQEIIIRDSSGIRDDGSSCDGGRDLPKHRNHLPVTPRPRNASLRLP